MVSELLPLDSLLHKEVTLSDRLCYNGRQLLYTAELLSDWPLCVILIG